MIILTKCNHFVILVLTELLERIEIVGDVPGDDVDAKFVPTLTTWITIDPFDNSPSSHEVVEALAGFHLEISDHEGREGHGEVLVVPQSVLDYIPVQTRAR